ncbi:MAG: phosphatase PAP2 family protein [Gemmataceae bacterium]|nr:phosphatase PAP2 family protein [Gemmataceae bacterium]
MIGRCEPFFAWPGGTLFGYALILGAAQSLWWTLIYVGANTLTGLHGRRVSVHLDFEQAIPFVPVFVLAYLSINLVFLPAPFVLRSRRELEALTLTLAAVTGVAGVGFLLFPATVAFPPDADAGSWTGLREIARSLALTYNLVPSLHVAMSCVALSAYGTRGGRIGNLLLAVWAGAIALATLLTHQHHLIDVATGLVLAWLGRRFIYERWSRQACTAQTPPANPSGDRAPTA